MWNKITAFFKPPVFSNDDDKTHAAALLNSTVLSIMAGTLLFTVFARNTIPSRLFGIVVPILLLQAGLLILIRRGSIQVASTGLVAGLWLILVYASYINGGVRAPAFSGIIVIVMAAGFLINIRSGLVVAGLSIAAGIWLILLEDRGVLPTPVTLGSFTILLAQITYFIVVVVLLALATRSIRQALARARLNEERYRLIASVMSDYAFSIRYGPDGTITDQWISGAFETITGYTSEEFIAQGGWTSIIHPKDKELDAGDMAKLHTNQKVVTEIRLIRKDGEVRWVRSYGHPLWDEKRNQLAGIYGAVQDITVHKEVENNLLQGTKERALLYQISLALTSTQDLYHALRAFVIELKRVMTIDAFHIGLYDSQTDLFSYSLFLNLEDDLQLPPRTLRDKPGLTWEVISTKRTLYLPDVSDPQTQHAHNIVVVVDAGIRSYIGIPLMLHDNVIGIMSVQSCQINAYSPDIIRLLETLAAQVAITIEKSRLLSELQMELFERQKLIIELETRNAEAETLRESTAIVASTLEISETVQRVLEQLKRIVQYDAASVWLYRGEKAVLMGSYNLPHSVNPVGEYVKSMDAPDHLFWQNEENALPYKIFEDVGEHYPIFRAPPLEYIRGWLGVSLQARGKLIGYIALDSRQHGKFSEHDAKMAVTLAEQVSIALENARLFSELQVELTTRQRLIEELESKNAESETLRESTAIVAATLDTSETVQLILEQIKRVVQFDSTSVWLYRGEKALRVGAIGLPSEMMANVEYIRSKDSPDYGFWNNEDGAAYILIEDVQDEHPIFRKPPLNYIRGWLGVSLRARGKLIGFIALDSHQPGKFTKHDAEVALTFAEQVSIALENARLFSDLQAELIIRKDLIAELESKNTELERFTYTVSHDLRSPLVTIKGFLGYMEKNASQGNMEGFRKDMKRVSSATDRMDGLLKNVLELSRIGRQVNKPQKLSFEDLVNEALENVDGRLQQHAIKVKMSFPLGTQPGLPAVYGDQMRLIEVLQNLLDNAAKYMGDQKKPLIEIGMNGYSDSGNPIFFVRDNGMGIDPKYHERIFGMFDKLDANSEGTGIGLSLVKRIIEFHECNIWVKSEVGKGSAFYFTLPGIKK